MVNIFRKKDFNIEKTNTTSGLKKTLGPVDIIFFGLGAIIGTGVFVLTGFVSSDYAGPAVFLSYIIAGITCIFVALVYAELASMIPLAGGIYAYSYVALGEIFAWMIGGVIILESGFAVSTIAIGWSAYLHGILKSANIHLPECLSHCPSEGGVVDLLALLIVLFVGSILCFGTTESKKINATLVGIKFLVILLFIVFTVPNFEISNFDNFMPNGFGGVLHGASILFFAFGGFSILTTAAEECKNPTKDLTIGIIFSLLASTLVYVVVSVVLAGAISYDKLNSPRVLAVALESNGNNLLSTIAAIGIAISMPTGIMMNIYAQSRIFYSMGRDNLLPISLAKLHKKYNSPHIIIVILTICLALIAGFFPYKTLGQLCSMGGLIDYIIAAIIVILLRIKLPNARRPFRCPIIYVVAPLALLLSTYLLFKQVFDSNFNLLDTGYIIIFWFIAILLLYFIRVMIPDYKIKNTI